MVDVGGGVGSLTLQLIRAYPHLRYVVQDRPKIIPASVKARLEVPDHNLNLLNELHSFGNMKMPKL